MRIAVVSDVHGNLTAFEAVLKNLRETAPDLVLHGGDLAEGGARPVEVIESIRSLGWQGVVGNTDEVLWAPEHLEEMATRVPKLRPLMTCIGEIVATTCEWLGADRIAWLRTLPQVQHSGPIALTHAAPNDLWRAPLCHRLGFRTRIRLQRSGCADRSLRAHPHAFCSPIRRNHRRQTAEA